MESPILCARLLGLKEFERQESLGKSQTAYWEYMARSLANEMKNEEDSAFTTT